MTQQIINVGNAVNDGTGESLRSAFQAVNNNFSNIWAQGPVDSQVVINNNVVSTNVTNRNLVLAANGVGVITVASTVEPTIDSVWDLGSANAQFDTVWARYYRGNAAYMTGLPQPANLLAIDSDLIPIASQAFDIGSSGQRWNTLYARDGNFSRNVTIGGNLTVMGNVIEMGNSVTDSLRIQLANSATTSAAADGAGLTVGANANIATILYNNANNVWTTNIGMSVGGPITGTSLAVSEATVYGNVNAVDGNFTGNVTANYFAGDGSQLTNIDGNNVTGLANVAYTGDYNDLINTPDFGNLSVDISTTGNVTGNYILGNGSQLTGLPAGYANANAVAYGEAGWAGNIIPAANVEYSLGSLEFQWKDLYVSNNTIYVNSIPLTLSSDNVLTVNGQPVLSNDSTTSITTSGNIAATEFFGNIAGANVVGTVAEAEHANVASEAWSVDAANVVGLANVATSGSYNDLIDTPNLANLTTDISTTGNITGNYFFGDGSQLTGIGGVVQSTTPPADPTDKTLWWDENSGRLYVWYNDGISTQWVDAAPAPAPDFANVAGDIIPSANVTYSLGNSTNQWKDLWVSNSTIYINSVPVTIDGTTLQVNGSNVVTAAANGTVDLTDISVTGNVTATYFIGDGSQLTGLPASYSDSNVASFLAAYGSNTVSTTGNITAGNFVGSGTNVDIVAGSYDWTFGNDGNLVLPGNTFAVKYANGATVSLAGTYGNSNVTTLLSSLGANSISTTGNVAANYLVGNGSQLTSVNAATVDILNTNGLGTTFYPTFVENRDSAEIVRADVDLTYRTDTNTLGVSNVSATNITLSGTGTAVNASGGNILTNQVTGTQFNFLNGLYTAKLNAGGATANYTLSLPANTGSNGQVLTTDGTGSLSWSTPASTYGNSNVATFLASYGSNTISTSGNITAGNLIGNISITGNVTGTSANVTLMASTYSWTFDNTGNLALPGNTFAVNYANGTAVSLGGNYGNANVVANLAALGSNPVSTTGNVTSGNLITAGTATTGVNALLAGPSFTPLANTSAGFVANVNSYSQVTFQNKNTGADATADYILTADNGSDSVNYGDFGIINSGYDVNTPTNSLGNIVRAADTYLYAQGNVSNTAQSGGNLVIGTATAGKTVKIFAGGNTASALVANISNTGVSVAGNVTASNFIGNISITGNIQGTTANVSLVAGSYTMTFDNTGILTLPAVGGSEGGEINLGIPTANTTLLTAVKFDVYQDRIRFFDGSTKGVYIDLSQAATGVNTLLNNRVSGIVNAGVFLTMDNLKATVTTSGNRGLSLATVSGTVSGYVSGSYTLISGSPGGSAASISLTTSASTSIMGQNFAGEGDTAIYVLRDNTNSRVYRITLIIGGGYSNNFISFERLL